MQNIMTSNEAEEESDMKRERARKGGHNCYGLTAGHAAYEQCVPMRRMSNAQSINLISNSDNIAHFESDSGCKSSLELMATNKTKRNETFITAHRGVEGENEGGCEVHCQWGAEP